MPFWSGVGARSPPTGVTYLTSSGEMPMSQVGPFLGLEGRGGGERQDLSICLHSSDCNSLRGLPAHQSSSLGDSWVAVSMLDDPL